MGGGATEVNTREGAIVFRRRRRGERAKRETEIKQCLLPTGDRKTTWHISLCTHFKFHVESVCTAKQTKNIK